jgi:hypothetical protein
VCFWKAFICGSVILRLISGKEFFVERYERLGWKFEDVKPRQVIRLTVTKAKGKTLKKYSKKRMLYWAI